jgi:3-hydroxyisobutyrate dehydrogenase-like beta-hydroxyacid dehydrogenase
MAGVPAAIAIIGFGEVGQTFAKDFLAKGVKEIHAFDIKFADPASGPSKAARALGVIAAKSSEDALAGQPIVFSCVTAGSAETAAREAAKGIAQGAYFADVNSVSPGTKQHDAAHIEEGGGRFVEIAVMSPIHPRGIRSPMLLGGPHAKDFAALMDPFEVQMTPVADRVGRAAATKLCRSVMIKGMESLFLESMISARKYGVEEDVLASMADTIPHDWAEEARYMISRALIHGRRRAEEMREAAKTVAEAGLEPLMTAKIAEREDWAANRAAELVGIFPETASLNELLRALSAIVPPPASK